MESKDNINDGWGTEKTHEGATRAPGAESPKTGENGRDSVSVSKETRDDGAEVTRVVHPPRYMKKTGELRKVLEEGGIDLENFRQGCIDGMNAMKAIPCKDGTIAYEPDWPVRLAYRKFVTETIEGMPVKRQEIVSRKLTTEEDLIARAKKSPALLKALLTQLTKLKEELSNNGGGDSE